MVLVFAIPFLKVPTVGAMASAVVALAPSSLPCRSREPTLFQSSVDDGQKVRPENLVEFLTGDFASGESARDGSGRRLLRMKGTVWVSAKNKTM